MSPVKQIEAWSDERDELAKTAREVQARLDDVLRLVVCNPDPRNPPCFGLRFSRQDGRWNGYSVGIDQYRASADTLEALVEELRPHVEEWLRGMRAWNNGMNAAVAALKEAVKHV